MQSWFSFVGICRAAESGTLSNHWTVHGMGVTALRTLQNLGEKNQIQWELFFVMQKKEAGFPNGIKRHSYLHTAIWPTSRKVRAFPITARDSKASCETKWRVEEIGISSTLMPFNLFYTKIPTENTTFLGWHTGTTWIWLFTTNSEALVALVALGPG